MTVNKLQQSTDYNLIKLALNATEVRSKTIAQNIANINTKNYKGYSVTFEETLNSEKGLSIKKTNGKHLGKDEDGYGEINVVQNDSTSMREDGNNVDIDLEKVNQAANTLMYNTLINQANSRISSTRYVITSGGR